MKIKFFLYLAFQNITYILYLAIYLKYKRMNTIYVVSAQFCRDIKNWQLAKRS
jgi:hypothetical protein